MGKQRGIKMNDYEIKLEEGHFSGASAIRITTNRAESSYGVPVAVLIGGPNDGTAYGPGDKIPCADPCDALAWLTEMAATTVAAANIAAQGDSANPLYAAFIALLPSRAQRYASKVREQTIREWMEDRGDSTDEYSRLPQENMEEEVIEAFVLSDGSRVAFTENSYVISHGAGHDAGEAEAFYEEHPAWAAEVRRQREE